MSNMPKLEPESPHVKAFVSRLRAALDTGKEDAPVEIIEVEAANKVLRVMEYDMAGGSRELAVIDRLTGDVYKPTRMYEHASVSSGNIFSEKGGAEAIAGDGSIIEGKADE